MRRHERAPRSRALRASRLRRPAPSHPRSDDERWMALALEHGRRAAAVAEPARRRGRREGRRARRRRATTSAPARSTPRSSRCSAAGDAAKGATLYVTLEPCNHHGRTPPCTDAIIAAKVARVVVGCRDPNPHVEGGGVEKLRAAGDRGRRRRAARRSAQRLIAPWTKFVTTALPYVSLKLALSLDGRIATRTGASKWVTGPEARAQRARAPRAARRGRRSASAPRWPTIRGSPCATRRATARSASSSTRSSACRSTSRLVQTAREMPTLGPLRRRRAVAERGRARRRSASRSCARRTRPRAASTSRPRSGCSRQRGIVTLMVEGGAELAGSLLAATPRRRAPRLHRADPARPARPPRRGRLGRPGHAAARRRASSTPAVGALRRRRLRVRALVVPRR